ncbi:hypothetical protein CRX69_02035 [Pseudomonas rhizophila]|uniref:Uncharacterized protein n=1 Tax=Pseudomonas rhizophila TaxID=2045200 RepID=A0ABN5JP94_9PSED|nr:hypothetical protein CRX69_02035 [Pseudomonas rhizophila]
MGQVADIAVTQFLCGSGLARESGGSVCDDVGCADAFASKPAPTIGFVSGRNFPFANRPLVGASLLAMAIFNPPQACQFDV